MIPKLIQRFFRNKYWQRITFTELSELYTSSMLRNLALSLIGIFVPIYLYELHYSLPHIFLYMAATFFIRIIADPIAGLVVGRLGPKHGLLHSYWVQIIALLLLLTLPSLHWPLWLVGSVWGISFSLFFVAYHTDFSAINHASQEGKELGYLAIVERLGGVLGPLLGGLVATFFGPQYTIAAAILFFATACLPLLFSTEPIPKQKRISYHNLPTKEFNKHWLAIIAFNLEGLVSVALWPLYIAVYIFLENTYASVGLVTSISIAMAIVSSLAIGKLVDKNKGGILLSWGATANALLHLVRPFTQGFQAVLGVNLANEAVTPAYRMPFLKGWYDTINLNPDTRIAYVVIAESIAALAKGTLWLVLWALAIYATPKHAMIAGFVLAALASLGIMLHRFAALRK